MQIFLDEMAARHLNDRIIMVLDGAGWHKSESLMVPDNLRLLSLPPYSPTSPRGAYLGRFAGKGISQPSFRQY